VTRSRTLALVLLCVGMTAIIGQVLLMRELLATLYGNELLFGLILAAWLGWGAIGAALALTGGRAAWRWRALAAGLAMAALLLPIEMALVRNLRTLLGATPGSMLDLGPLVLAVALVLAPLCLCLGALFTVGTRCLVEEGGTPGQAYFLDSAGAAAGGILFSFLFVRWLSPFQTAFVVSGFDLAAIFLVTRATGLEAARRSRRDADMLKPTGGRLQTGPQSSEAASRGRLAPVSGIVAAIVIAAILAAAAVPFGRLAENSTLRLEWPSARTGTAQSLLFSGDSPYGRLAVQARGSQRIFYTDGLLAFETQGTFPEEVTHLPLLAHPAPREVLLIGGGIAGDLREILKHPVEKVTYVELDPLLLETARDFLPPEDAGILDDPRVQLIMTDGRAFVASASERQAAEQTGRNGGQYDAIILDLPEPTTGALNRFYTAEFFSQVRNLLHPGGIFSFGLPSAENYWNPELAERNASIYRTLSTAYPAITILPGEHDFFLASDRPIDTNPDALSRRLTERGIVTRWVTPGYIHDLLTGDRFVEAQRRVGLEAGADINRDLSPLSYYYSLAQWLARFYPGLRQAFEGARLFGLWWLAIPLALALVLARWKRSWRAPVVVAAVGIAQMLLELVVLFAFQAMYGSLYLEVGLIVTAFMGGLALGSAAGSRMAAPTDRRSRFADSESGSGPASESPGPDSSDTRSKVRSPRFLRRALVGVLAGLAVYCAALPLLFLMSQLPGGTPRWAFPALALIGGLLGGMVFPLASGLPSADTQSRAGTASPGTEQPSYVSRPSSAIGGILYAADLGGGCVGALLGVALFIPIAGIPSTCAAIAVLAAVALLAVL
jgi:spermidine synthase